MTSNPRPASDYGNPYDKNGMPRCKICRNRDGAGSSAKCSFCEKIKALLDAGAGI